VTLDDTAATSMMMGVGRIRKFASGYHQREKTTLRSNATTLPPSPIVSVSSSFSTCPSPSPQSSPIAEQEQIIGFHCLQLFSLIGPNALLADLRTSEVVLVTAITFLRRFYLSNSVVDISPRKIAVACAFLAAKVEEEKIDVSLTPSEPA
jgi:hypothetical protein